MNEPAPLVDVSDIPFDDLLRAHGDSPVVRSIRRLQASLDDPNGVLSAFSSFIDERHLSARSEGASLSFADA